MTKFHAGQEVEVTDSRYPLSTFSWLKAKIAYSFECEECGMLWKVQFPDGTHGTFVETHIRAIKPNWSDNFPSDYECADGSFE